MRHLLERHKGGNKCQKKGNLQFFYNTLLVNNDGIDFYICSLFYCSPFRPYSSANW